MKLIGANSKLIEKSTGSVFRYGLKIEQTTTSYISVALVTTNASLLSPPSSTVAIKWYPTSL